MRTGIGVSLFRGGSDVLFHPRRRQSCRIAKTYHTIVSKFAHLLISRSFLRYLSVSFVPPFLPSRRLSRWLSGGSLYLFILISFHLTTSSLFFLFRSLRLPLLLASFILFIVAIFISRIYPVSAERVSWYAPAKFSAVFRLRAGPEGIGWNALRVV